jgi:hypothetical protein
MNERICQFCNSNKTYRNNWININDNPCCIKCYKKYRLRYKDKHIICKDKTKKDQCSKCNKKVGDKYINKKGEIKIIKYTTTHHDIYDDSDPLAHTEELCISCHNYKGKPRKNPQRIDNKLKVCPKCNSTNLVKNGVEHLSIKKFQRYKCKNCKKNSY